jgi:hypothetical protein
MSAHAIQLHAGMGPAILDYLAKMDTLPTFGCVAGQAVASAIDNLYGRGGGVFNDIDVFIPVEYGTMRSSTKASKPPSRFTPKYVESGAYGEMQKFLLQVGTYELEATSRRGLVNRIYITFSGELRTNDHSLRVISSFDLNCTRVAVDLRSKRLWWDHHFEHYLRTRELRIVTAHTPVHTFLRLLKKREELADVSVDMETAARACFVMQDAVLKPELRRSGAASFIFGEKYRAMAESLQSAWAPYYAWDEEWLHLVDAGENEWAEGAGDELTTDAVSLYTLRPRGELEKVYSEAARELGVMSVVLLPPRMYAEREAYHKTIVNGTQLDLNISNPPESRLHAYQMARGADYLFGVQSSVNWQELDVFLDSALGRTTYGMSALKQLDMVDELKTLQKSLGVPDGLRVLLDAWQGVKSLDPGTILPVARQVLELERKPTILQPLPPTPPQLQLNPACSPVTIRQIPTERELKELAFVSGGRLSLPSMWSSYVLMLEDETSRSALACIYSPGDKKPTGAYQLYNFTAGAKEPSIHHQQVAQAILAAWHAAGSTCFAPITSGRSKSAMAV